MSEYAEDCAGVFTSDAHRQVIGHLSQPTDEFAYPLALVCARVYPSVVAPADVERILAEAAAEGLAECVDGGWRMTADGFALLTGPIANEPPPDAVPTGPALVGSAVPIPTKESK